MMLNQDAKYPLEVTKRRVDHTMHFWVNPDEEERLVIYGGQNHQLAKINEQSCKAVRSCIADIGVFDL